MYMLFLYEFWFKKIQLQYLRENSGRHLTDVFNSLFNVIYKKIAIENGIILLSVQPEGNLP